MTKKTFYSFLAIILAGAIVLACAIGSSWFTNGDFKTWFNSWGQDSAVEPDKQPDKPSDGDEVCSGNVVVTVNKASSFMRLAAAPVQASAGSYTLTATVLPSEATYKDLDWTIAWKDASGEWANGKAVTDYCMVMPTSDGALTASLSCKQAFGEQIIVTATNRDDSTKSATCTVDYRKRLLGVTTSFTNGYGYGGTFSEEETTDNPITLKVYDTSNESSKYTLNVTLNESIGTISNDYSYEFYLFGSNDLVNFIKNGNDIYGSRPQVITTKSSYNKWADDKSLMCDLSETFLFNSVMYMDLDWYEDDYRAACNELIGRLSKWSNEFLLAPTLYVTYNGIEYSYAYRAKLDVSGIKVAVSDVTLGDDNIIF